MSVEAIAALTSASGAMTAPSPVDAGSGFSSILDRLSGLNTQLTAVDQQVQQLALGHTDNLHQVMINMEQARLQFDLVLQVRNKILDAYQELMRMQV